MAARDNPSPAPFRACQGCGAWSQGQFCSHCGWSRTDPTIANRTSSPRNPFPLRILVDLTLDRQGGLRIGQIFSQRLRWLAQRPSWLVPLEQPDQAADPDLKNLLILLQEHLNQLYLHIIMLLYL